MGGWGCTTGRSGPDCTVVGPRSGRDCAVTRSFALQGGILSNTGGKDGPGAFREDSGKGVVLLGISPELSFFFPGGGGGAPKRFCHSKLDVSRSEGPFQILGFLCIPLKPSKSGSPFGDTQRTLILWMGKFHFTPSWQVVCPTFIGVPPSQLPPIFLGSLV